MRLDDEVARIEIPKWVADDKAIVEQMHCVVLDQCRRGKATRSPCRKHMSKQL